MNAVERIEAAIQKLEVLKAETTPGPWLMRYVIGDPQWPVIISEGIGAVINTSTETFGTVVDADLIVVLHRTIDAQIRVLGEGKREYYRYGSMFPTDILNAALALADAILGDAS